MQVDVAADVNHWMWSLLHVQDFIALGLAWIADQPVPASSFTRGALFVTVLAFVDREELSFPPAKTHPAVWSVVLELYISTAAHFSK